MRIIYIKSPYVKLTDFLVKNEFYYDLVTHVAVLNKGQMQRNNRIRGVGDWVSGGLWNDGISVCGMRPSEAGPPCGIPAGVPPKGGNSTGQALHPSTII